MVASEFFEQGDIEKLELHIKPMDMMDRDKKDQLPSMQVGFIDSICLPVYQVSFYPIHYLLFAASISLFCAVSGTLLNFISQFGNSSFLKSYDFFLLLAKTSVT